MTGRIGLGVALIAVLAICMVESAEAGFMENNLKLSRIHSSSTVGYQYSVHITVEEVDVQSDWHSDCLLSPAWLSLFAEDTQRQLVTLESTNCL